MQIFLFFIIAMFLSLIVYFIYLINKFFIHKIVHNKYLSLFISTIPIIISYFFLNYVNTLIIILHIIIIYWLILIIKKLIKKEISQQKLFIISVILTTIYLGIGLYNNLHIKETHYVIYTQKDLGQENFRIIQISDAHIGTTLSGKKLQKQIERISQIDSDIVVITGDFVDDDTKKVEMIEAVKALKQLKPKYGIYFIYGNHDKGYFNYRDFEEKDLVNELKKENIHILEDQIMNIDNNIYLIGRKDKSDKKRKSIDELTKDLDRSKYLIDLNHQPNDYKNEKNKVDLVLSGHTHGGQLFPLGYLSLLIKANDAFSGITTKGKTTFIVNSGISDWSILFKTGAKSEFIVIDIKNK